MNTNQPNCGVVKMTTYSITLDDVDLALLPLRTHKYNDFLKKEHFQFQLMKADIIEEPEPTIFYTCHTCAIQVPAAFGREHTTSIKHRANARIASVAAERTRALITALPPPTCAQPTARFCANCATVVGRNHEKTKEHRVAVMHDKLLWELMTAYVGNDDDDESYDSDYSEPEYIAPDLGIQKETGSQNFNDFGTFDTINGKEKQRYDSTALKTIEAEKEINKNEMKEDDRRKDYKDNKNVDNTTKNSEKTDNIESSCRDTEITPNSHDSPVRKTEPITRGEHNPTSIKPTKTDTIGSSSQDTEITPNSHDSPVRKTEPITRGEHNPTSIKPKKNDTIGSSSQGTEITPNSHDSPVRKTEPITKGEHNPTSIKPTKTDIIGSSSQDTEITPNSHDSPVRNTEPITKGELNPKSIKPKKTDIIGSSSRDTEITPNSHDSPVRKTEPITRGEHNPTSVKPKKTDNIESSNRETKITPNGHGSAVRKTEPITKGEENPTSTKPKDTNYQDNKETETSTNLDTPYTKPKVTENIKIEYIEFVTNDNKQVKVFSDYYHSFTRKMETINCIACSSTFKTAEVNSHMFSLKHLNKMPSTLINEHCVRQINDTYSHCILCNQMVKNSNVTKHYLTIGHGQREKQAVTNTNQATTSKIDKTVNRDLVLANIDVKAKAANVKVNLKSQEKVKTAQNEPKSKIDWPVIYPFEVNEEQENTVRCVICDCKVPNNPDNRKSHLVGGNHAKNVKNKRNLYPYENTDRDGVARCVICDVKVNITPENLKEHLTGFNHAKNVIIRKDALRATTSKAPVTVPTTKHANKTIERTFESTSDTIGGKFRREDYYFSWV